MITPRPGIPYGLKFRLGWLPKNARKIFPCHFAAVAEKRMTPRTAEPNHARRKDRLGVILEHRRFARTPVSLEGRARSF